MTKSKKRIESFDFVRGMLLVFMTMAHVEFAFPEVNPGDELYYVLRFAQRGFVLLAAFSLTYLSYNAWSENPAPVRQRLIQRSLKLLGVFIVLNVVTMVALMLLRPGQDILSFYTKGIARIEEVTAEWSYLRIVYEVFVVRSAFVSYDILVPIAYMLFVAPFVFKLISRNSGLICTIIFVFGVLFLLNFLKDEKGHRILKAYYNLDLLTYGIGGMVGGLLAMRYRESLHTFRQGWTGLLASACLTAVIYIVLFCSNPDEFRRTSSFYQWFHLLWLSVILLFLYQLHQIGRRTSFVMKPLLLFSRYSLVVYILQVFFLKLLMRPPYPMEGWPLYIFVTLLNLCIVWTCVISLDFGRKRFLLVDKIFRAVFP